MKMTSKKTSCAACKSRRKKCTPDCILAPHFPQSRLSEYRAAERVFGFANILKVLRSLVDPQNRKVAAESIIYDAAVREKDPVGGCRRIITDLHRQVRHYGGGGVANGQETKKPSLVGVLDSGQCQELPNQLQQQQSYFEEYPFLEQHNNNSIIGHEIPNSVLEQQHSNIGHGIPNPVLELHHRGPHQLEQSNLHTFNNNSPTIDNGSQSQTVEAVVALNTAFRASPDFSHLPDFNGSYRTHLDQ